MLLNATSRHSAGEAVVGVVMVGQDITQKKVRLRLRLRARARVRVKVRVS